MGYFFYDMALTAAAGFMIFKAMEIDLVDIFVFQKLMIKR
ncbi:hypothetical protein FM120_28500 [Sphingobacterium faecium PCAi_F2.5]|nr:hypothetical protein FM120_28500 [Sphingobacterium faecium PCAi_F2.5]